MKMNLKGTIAAVALVFGMSAVSAEGLSFGGYFRTGAAFNLDSDASKAEAKYAEGNYYGGGDRLRLNIAYDSGSAGVTFRFQNAATGAYFSEDNVKWAMGYAKLFDGLVVAEAGILTDSYTGSDGWEGYDFSGSKGIGLVVLPVEGLAIQSTFLLDGTYADVGDLTLNAKYTADGFAVAGGYKFSGEAFGYVGISAVEDLSAAFEVKWVKDSTLDFVEDIGYSFTDSFSAGLLAYERLGGDDPVFEFNPHAMFGIDDTFAVSAESYITVPTAEGEDVSFTVTPALWISVPKATVSVFYTFEKDGDTTTNVAGAGVKVAL